MYYKTLTRGEKLVIDYTGLNIWQVQELDLDLYLFFMREAFIHEMNQTKEGRNMAEAGPELIQMVNGEAVVTPLTASARNTALETAEGGGKSFVQNVNITSPKALSPYETARQTRNATRNMVLQLQGG